MRIIHDAACRVPRRRWHETIPVLLLVWPLVFIVGVLACVGFAPSAHASGSALMATTPYPTANPYSYSGPPFIDRRDYTVVIQRNGDVSVVEHWTIRINAEPNELHLVMSTARTTGIEFVNVAGSGVHCDCPNRTHSYSANSPNFDMSWYFVASQIPEPADSETQELRTYSFDVSYILHGAVGLSSTRAWLDWQFLDTGSGINRLNSCTVSMTLPALASPRTIQIAATDPDSPLTTETVDGAAIVSSGASLDENNLLEVEMSFPRSLLSPSVKRPTWQKGEKPPVPPTSLGTPRALLYFIIGYPHYPSDAPIPARFQLLTPTSCTCCLLLIILLNLVPLLRASLRNRALRRTISRWPRTPTPDSG